MKVLTLLLLLHLPMMLTAQEKVFYNARIFTADNQHSFAEAIAISGKKITSVGRYDEVKKTVGAAAEWINCYGRFLMPGLIDSHIHAIGGGLGLTKANVSDKLLTINDLVAYAKSVVRKKEGFTGDVLVIFGINISTWSHLDEIILKFNSDEFALQPVVLKGSDGHTLWANNVMMKRAGLDKEFILTLKPEDRIYYGIDKDDEPNGFLSESGQGKIRSVIPKDADYHKAAEKAMDYCNRHGITSILDPSAGNTGSQQQEILEAYTWLIKTGKLTAHVAGTIVSDVDADLKTQINSVKALQKNYNGENLTIIGCKVFADGVIEHPTHTAALSLPYVGTSSAGVLMFDPKKFIRFAIEADKQDLVVHVHAIGDRAVTETLNGFDAVRKANGNQAIPHTITHLQIVQPTDFDRFEKLNVLAAYQLLWAFGDVTTIDIVKPYIHPSLYQWQYPARSLLQAGATIGGASDWPVTSANPFEAMYFAETRLGPKGVLDSTQCMPRMPMLYAYTINAAKVMRAEKNVGSLEPGKFADLILLDRDLLTVTPAAMKSTRVLWTMFEGKMVYKASLK